MEGQLNVYDETIRLREQELAQIRANRRRLGNLIVSRLLPQRAMALGVHEHSVSLELAEAKFEADIDRMATEVVSPTTEQVRQSVDESEKRLHSSRTLLHQVTSEPPLFNDDGELHTPVEVVEERVAEALKELHRETDKA